MHRITTVLLALLFVAISQSLRAQIVVGPVTNVANGHLYYLVGPAFWTNAEAQAVRLGGHLVTINDEVENTWVLSTFGNFGGGLQALHIGFTDQAHEGQWIWVSGEPVTFTKWNGGEPNNGMGGFPYENVCAMYGPADPRAGSWNDLMGTLEEQQSYGVVEVPPQMSIRVSEVELSWPTVLGVVYQPQYRSGLSGSTWANLGSPTNGTGTVITMKDAVPYGEPQRFYRVITNP